MSYFNASFSHLTNRQTLRQLLPGSVIVLICIALGFLFFGDNNDYVVNLYTDVVGIFATITIIDLLARKRDQERRINERRERLVMEAGSSSNETARRALDLLRRENCLTGESGLLQGGLFQKANWTNVDLENVNLQDAILKEATLSEAYLKMADLTHCNLKSACLVNAYLLGANLNRSDLYDAKLNSACLTYAVLTNAILDQADLRGADLHFADLRGVSLKGTLFDTDTILPDGKNWHDGMDWSHYTE